MDMDPMGQMAGFNPPGAQPGGGFLSRLGGKMSGQPPAAPAPEQMMTSQGMNPGKNSMALGADPGFAPQAMQPLANIAPPRENVGGPGMGNMQGIQGGAAGMTPQGIPGQTMDPQKKMMLASMLSKIAPAMMRR